MYVLSCFVTYLSVYVSVTETAYTVIGE